MMRKTLKNRNIDFPPSSIAAERLADYKGEGHPLGNQALFCVICSLI